MRRRRRTEGAAGGRLALALGLGLTALGSPGCGGASGSRAEGLRHVLLISLDNVRADDLTFRDAQAAPNLAALAARGTVFTQALSGTSWTLPGHVQLLTGQGPSLSRVEDDSVRIDAGAPSLAAALRSGGFATLGVYTSWFLAPDYGFERGFDAYVNAMTDGERRATELERALTQSTPGELARLQTEVQLMSHQDVTSANVVATARRLLGEVADGAGVFLFAHFFDPHYDFVPPGDWATRFDPDYEGDIDGHEYWVNRRIWDFERNVRVCSERDVEHLRALYRGEIGWTDENVGRLLQLLEASGRLDETLIVVTSDHGEEFFEHGARGHRHTLYDELLRVPLLVVLPGALGAAAPRRVDQQVTLSDVLPTILDYAGVALPEGADGRSLRPLLEGRELEPRPALASLQLYPRGRGSGGPVVLLEALRTPTEKLLRATEVTPGSAPALRGLMWFDLVADPLEQHPLTGPPRDLLRRDARVLSAWERMEQRLAELRAIAARTQHQGLEQRTTGVSQVLESELRALGYADGGSGASSLHPPWGLRVRPAMPLPGTAPR